MKPEPIPEHHQKRLDYLSFYIRELRFAEGITQYELSEKMNLHRNTILRAENAKNLTLISLFELADAMEISLNELFLDME